jgi:hypothetical protein
MRVQVDGAASSGMAAFFNNAHTVVTRRIKNIMTDERTHSIFERFLGLPITSAGPPFSTTLGRAYELAAEAQALPLCDDDDSDIESDILLDRIWPARSVLSPRNPLTTSGTLMPVVAPEELQAVVHASAAVGALTAASSHPPDSGLSHPLDSTEDAGLTRGRGTGSDTAADADAVMAVDGQGDGDLLGVATAPVDTAVDLLGGELEARVPTVVDTPTGPAQTVTASAEGVCAVTACLPGVSVPGNAPTAAAAGGLAENGAVHGGDEQPSLEPFLGFEDPPCIRSGDILSTAAVEPLP